MLLVPNGEALKRRLKSHHIDLNSENAINESLKILEEEINHFRTGNKFGHMFPQRWLPAATSILSEGFTQENLMLNSTMKMVRNKITDFYEDNINFMYTPAGKNLYNDSNKNAIKKILSL